MVVGCSRWTARWGEGDSGGPRRGRWRIAGARKAEGGRCEPGKCRSRRRRRTRAGGWGPGAAAGWQRWAEASGEAEGGGEDHGRVLQGPDCARGGRL